MRFKSPSRAACTLTVGLTLLVATTIFAQKLSAPTSDDETTAKLVCNLISRYHIDQRKIDDRISVQMLDRFVEVLDPQKLYFMQSDIAQLQKYRTELDNLLVMGDVDFAYKVYDLYEQRVEQQVAVAHKWIDADHDFSVDESIVIDTEEVPWARSQSELDERWRKRIKYDLLNIKLDADRDEDKSEQSELAKARERLHKRYRTLERSVQETEDSEKLETYLSAMTHCFDPHSSYMSPQTLEEFRISMELSLEGIGAALRSEDGYTTVAQIIPGGAADKDGRLQVGDKILAVGQAEGEMVDIVEMKLSKVVRQIRGKRGTKVRLRVKQADTGKIEDYTLTRQKIDLSESSAVKGEIINTKERLNDRTARVGIIRIPSFYRDFRGAQRGDQDFKSTARDVLEVLRNFRDQGGVDAIVVDLRTNGGGALSEAIEVSGLFLKEGPIVQVKEQDGEVKTHDDVDPLEAYRGPLVVLCNRLSASASEIFAGVIKDYDRGIVVGDTTTHGKGTVQNVMPVSNKLFQFLNPRDRGALKLTINQFYRVNGDSTQNRGVPSDIVLPSMVDHMDVGESYLDNALEFDRIPPADYEPVGLVNSDIISRLRKASQRRVAADSEFQELREDIDDYLERKNRETVSLNEQVRRKEIQDNEDESDLKEEEAQLNGEGPVFPDNHYNNEVLAITVDYVSMLRGAKTVQK